jgi:hypothetical protein
METSLQNNTLPGASRGPAWESMEAPADFRGGT